MRAVFIFVVLLVVLALAVPATFAVRYWLDGGAVIARAEQSGDLRAPSAAPLTRAEYAIAMSEFGETWRTRVQPCRTLANLYFDLTSESAPTNNPVSVRLASALLDERRGTSVRWQIRRLIVSCQLERRYDDRQMLRLWLQGASFGQDELGIENAARAYFGRSSRDLNNDQSARLAVLLRAPSLRNQPERWTERARLLQERIAAGAR